MGEPSPLRNPLGTRGSACVEVMTTLHGSTPSIWRHAEGCIPPEEDRWTVDPTGPSSGECLVRYHSTATSSAQSVSTQAIPFTLHSQTEVAPPPVTLPIPTLEDPHTRLYGIKEGIARELWPKSSPIDSKGKKSSGGQRSGDVGAISSAGMRPPRHYQTVRQTSGFYYPSSPHVQYRPPAPSRPMTPTYLHPISQLVLPHMSQRDLLPHTPDLELRRPPLMCRGHHVNSLSWYAFESSFSTAHRGWIIDSIGTQASTSANQGLVNLGQPSVTTNPLPAHSTHAVPPHPGDIHHIDLIEDDSIHMLSWDDGLPEPIILHDSHRVPSVLLDNGSDLNICPLATIVAFGFAPSDFGSSTQIVRAYNSTKREVMGRPWIHRAGVIPSSLHQKVKFIHDGQVITVRSTRDMFASSEPVLQISHNEDDLFLIGFTFDELQTLEIEDFYRDFVVMSFDQHSSTMVLDMIRGMTFLPGMGLGRRQQDQASL
ncbi:hypothetical protein CK203_105889 [Vitis vinifera]|uniref:Uncharacterized protein n=1 Tax=Vitis vinifera TaxID=29760 RepID=A0A438EI56_VITVI|nr:hypothetical protein CK203_105889 [Vitis vinifera]